MRTSPVILRELNRIAKKSKGLLIPEKVVEEARSEASPLHDQFNWDDTEAARQYRIYQAKNLIRTIVRYAEINGDKRAVRVFVSLTPDREEDGGGYRDVVAVLSDKSMRRQMLEDAMNELAAFEKKYANLKELTEVFVASKKARLALLTLVAA